LHAELKKKMPLLATMPSQLQDAITEMKIPILASQPPSQSNAFTPYKDAFTELKIPFAIVCHNAIHNAQDACAEFGQAQLARYKTPQRVEISILWHLNFCTILNSSAMHVRCYLVPPFRVCKVHLANMTGEQQQ